MAIDIAYFLYIFGDIGANMLSCEQDAFTSSQFIHRLIRGGWGICTPDPKSKLLNESTW